MSWGPYTLFKVIISSPKSWKQAREKPFTPLTSPQQRTPAVYFQAEFGWVSVGLLFTGEVAKFRRFLIPYTSIIILFSAVWSEEGWTLVLPRSSIFILASFFGSKICQNWKPSCVKWHLICPKQRRRELVHLSHLLLYILSLQRVKSTELCSLILAENLAEKIYLATSLFTWALSQTWAVIHIQKRNRCWRQEPFFMQSCLLAFFLPPFFF